MLQITNELEGFSGNYKALYEGFSYLPNHKSLESAIADSKAVKFESFPSFLYEALEGDITGLDDFVELQLLNSKLTGINPIMGITLQVGEQLYFMSLKCMRLCFDFCQSHKLDDLGTTMNSIPDLREYLLFGLNLLKNEELSDYLKVEDVSELFQIVSNKALK
ncbi:hypothetical protein [Vibrio owensii]|uniref:hypothetical protein n=1 Tax=Vibrio owensii TaxID=696485 RepID=UPI0018F1A81A|nr:hypothetical protein [Vibrio owensii]